MTALTDVALAVLLGGALGGGVLLMLAALPRWRVATLSRRIAPYVRHVVPDDRMPEGVVRAPVLSAAAAPLWSRLRDLLGRVLGGDGAIALRLGQAGLAPDVTRFRGRQLAVAVTGLAAGALLVVVFAVTGRMNAAVVLLPVLGAVGGALAVDAQLTARARARMHRLADELPTTLEFLALCLSAGEGFFDTLRRVAAVGTGELTGEFHRVVLAVNTGSPLADALAEMSARLDSPAVARAIDQVIAALERGAPLAGVLQSQAADAREDAKRILIEQAGRKEIAMMLPLVFLILPLSVLFAVFPGVFLLQIGLN